MSSGKKYTLFSALSIAFKVYPMYIMVFILIVICNGLFDPLNVVVMQQFIDRVLDLVQKQGNLASMIPLLATIVILQMYRHFHPTFEYFVGMRFQQKVKEYFMSILLDKMARLDYQHIENKETYDLIHRVKQGAETKVKESLDHLAKIAAGVIGILGVFAIIWQAGWWISIAILCVIMVTTYFAYRCGTRKFVESVVSSEIERRVDYYESLFSDRSVALELKLFGAAEFVKKRFRQMADEEVQLFLAMEMRNKPNIWIVLRLIGNLLLLFTYIILLYPLANQTVTIGFYLATVSAMTKLVGFITDTAPESLEYLFVSHRYWREVGDFFALAEQDQHCAHDWRAPDHFRQIKFDNVYFRYPGADHYTLQGVSFTIERGKHYAIVGKNGAGKSTIIKLLTGLYRVDQGEITIDGVNIDLFPMQELARFFSVVFQDFGKYNISIMDHIQLPQTSAAPDLTRIHSIADQLGFHETVCRMPQGYDTLLGKLTEEGIDLSGGEWQKVALCRAIYADTSVRILDEPTAALDPEAESRLYQLFADSLSRESSTILISHRLGSTKLADEIILIDNGVVREQGTHHELMKQGGLYRKMFDVQKAWYGQRNQWGREGEDEYAENA